MILPIDDNYRIVSDEHNFILQKKMDPEKNPRKGKRAKSAEKWKNIGYWADLSQLLASYTRQVLRTEIGKTTFTAISRDPEPHLESHQIIQNAITPGREVLAF